ncbi:hypothetical protein MKX01_025877 [Papaver californicum]|nr:hypothetical protein MKX01_025877 [Papaver californicum]
MSTPRLHQMLKTINCLGMSTTIDPKQINEITNFLLTTKIKDARSVRIKKSKNMVKFKVRCSNYLYTLCIPSRESREVKQSLPPVFFCVPSSIHNLFILFYASLSIQDI